VDNVFPCKRGKRNVLVRGLKANIALNIAVFLLIAGFGANLVTAYIYHGLLLKAEDRRARDMLDGLAVFAFPMLKKTASGPLPAGYEGQMPWNKPWIVNFMVFDTAGRTVFRHLGDTGFQALMRELAAGALKGRAVIQKRVGYHWHLTGPRYDFLLTAIRLEKGSRPAGACVLLTSLAHVNRQLDRYQKGIFFYILINTFILTLVALYRLFKIYLRPVDRLVGQAEKYSDDEEPLFAVRREDNELGRLSSALNSMLKRIAQDKQKLRETVVRLEEANRSLKEAQQEMVRAEKMASVGRLAAGIAHEIGNPIGIVLGYLELLKDGDLEAQERAEFLLRAEEEIQRINRIIRQLLDLARPAATGTGKVAVLQVLKDLISILAAQPMMSGIEISSRLDARADQVAADEEQLRQVFLNLFLNAADAIAEKGGKGQGRIQVAARNVSPAGSCARSGNAALQLVIEISDNGAGIREEDLANVFDPFFSTKAPGKGTGLGLAVSYMIIQQLGGSIRIAGRAGSGSTATVVLPVAGQDVSGPKGGEKPV